MIPVMSKNQLDRLWQELTQFEALIKPNAEERLHIQSLRRKIELNARRIVWNTRGILVLEGGKKNAA